MYLLVIDLCFNFLVVRKQTLSDFSTWHLLRHPAASDGPLGRGSTHTWGGQVRLLLPGSSFHEHRAMSVQASCTRGRSRTLLQVAADSFSLSTSNCQDGSSLPTEPRICLRLLFESVLFTHLKLCLWCSRAGDAGPR